VTARAAFDMSFRLGAEPLFSYLITGVGVPISVCRAPRGLTLNCLPYLYIGIRTDVRFPSAVQEACLTEQSLKKRSISSKCCSRSTLQDLCASVVANHSSCTLLLQKTSSLQQPHPLTTARRELVSPSNSTCLANKKRRREVLPPPFRLGQQPAGGHRTFQQARRQHTAVFRLSGNHLYKGE
jgi:hypothetical protein